MKRFLTAASSLLLVCSAMADLKIDPIFTSNMMLQQEAPISFFGSADKNSTVTVEFNGKKVTAKTDNSGNWNVKFPPLKAGNKNFTVKISDGKQNIKLNDVVIGDIWICAGQSNMEMPIAKKFRRGWSAQNCEQEVANAKYPEIRYADQQNRISHNKIQPNVSYAFGGGWVKCSPQNADRFSATAYFFARKLHKDLKTPIGLLNLTWSGTCIQTWISLEGFRNAKLQNNLNTIKKFDLNQKEKQAYEKAEHARFQKEIGLFHEKFAAAGAKEKDASSIYATENFDDSAWKNANASPNIFPVARWYRTKFSLPQTLKNKNVVLSVRNKPAEAIDVYLNGKRIAGFAVDVPQSEKKIKVSIKPEQLNQNGTNVLAFRAEYFYHKADTRSMNNILFATQLSNGKNSMSIGAWKGKDEFVFPYTSAKIRLPAQINIPYISPQFYSNLYNGMVDAWTKIPVKGVIWYQGCSNAGQEHYYLLHKALIADWRAKWNNPQMPFLIVQLAGFGDANWKRTPPSDARYAFTRDIQAQMIQDPRVGLACAVDIGEPSNIHPANKQEVGRRLALEAERIAYGKKIVSRGPMLDKAVPEGKQIRVFYKYADNGLKTTDGKEPKAFAIAGADKKFVWANARIDGKNVLVSSPSIPSPKYVRYAYAAYRGDCNLQNAEGLAAYPFRSDAYDYSKVK